MKTSLMNQMFQKLADVAVLLTRTLHPKQITRQMQRRKLILVGIANLLVGANVWAQVVAPTGLTASSVTSSSVTLGWTDSSTKNDKKLVVSRSLQSVSGY